MAAKLIVKSSGFMPKSRHFSTLAQVRLALAKNVIGGDWLIRYSDSEKECTVSEMLQRYNGEEKRAAVYRGSEMQKKTMESLPKNGVTACPKCKGELLLFFDRVELQCDSCGTFFELRLIQKNPRTFLLLPQLESEISEGARKYQQLKRALDILGIDAGEIDENVLRSAYRLAMKEFHPDKVAHLGGGIQALASERSRAINHAYQVVRKHYGFL
ncbi:MAG: hypothetical protein ACRC37_06795 [Lentisphaeria bacterium]